MKSTDMDGSCRTYTGSYAGSISEGFAGACPGSSTRQSLLIPSGLIGCSGYHSYVLSHVPYRNLANFKVLQSVENSRIAFLVLQLNPFNSVMSVSDIEFIAEVMNVKIINLQVLLVATPQLSEDGKYNITLNTKAPIFVDKSNNIAMQYVLQSSHYNTKHKYCVGITQ
ncbi:flagellar assembly protein FliW [Candidatus Lariskella endosymbiont of Epinotia ramella]|uniref:flagellar assembly protein FliW n=1 Tax=Candidatus Lariskella endosymbiont of Epinotia ramella TaxID=3066224 RepID=UPI0030D0342D